MPNFLYSQLFVCPANPTRSFDGETVLITGANVGLGKEAVRYFAQLGASRIILGVRNVEAGEEAKKNIEQSTKRRGICEVWEIDLASHSSVLAFADKVAELPRLDTAILNAAVSTTRFGLAEGYELTITVNVINTLLLGILLIPTLRATSKCAPSVTPRLSFVGSEVHAWAKFAEWREEEPLKAVSDKSKADMSGRYFLSKLLEMLLVQELAGRVLGSEIIINMVNPGLCRSQLLRESAIRQVIVYPLARRLSIGSRCLVLAASAGAESHGGYITDGVCDNSSLSSFVRSEDGRKARQILWAELSGIVEGVRPGTMNGI